MKHLIVINLLASALLVCATPSHAQTATREDAVALVEKAVAHVKKVGIPAACKDFANPAGEFMKGELYVFVQSAETKMICHAANPKINGKDLAEMKDVNGKQFGKEQTALVMSKGKGWVDYVFLNPVSKALEPKLSYGQKIDEASWLGVGIYRK
ncbi:MAG: cache domain-containing protein [Pseudomonadota bacterium]